MPAQVGVVQEISRLVPSFGLARQERRPLAVLLRSRGATQTTTARVLRVSKATVSRDLKYCRQHPLALPGISHRSETVGSLVAFCEEVRVLAFTELARLELDPTGGGPEGTPARLCCLRVVLRAERLLLLGLEAAGLLPTTWRQIRRRPRRHKAPAVHPLSTPQGGGQPGR